MKKLGLIALIFLLTGCQIVPLPNNLDRIVDVTLKTNHRPNYVTKGYKLYLPVDARVDDDRDNNLVIYHQGRKLYMYTDLISYYYKYQEGFMYEVNNSLFYSRNLDYEDKLGYIDIRKDKNAYLVQVVYNYAKIETVVTKQEINNTVRTSLRILKSIIYKQKIIEALLDNKSINNNDEEIYQLFKPKQNKTDFIQYMKDYDKYSGEVEVPEPVYDPDQIELEDTAADDTT